MCAALVCAVRLVRHQATRSLGGAAGDGRVTRDDVGRGVTKLPFAWQGARVSRQDVEVALVLLRGKSKKAGGTAVGPKVNIRFRQGEERKGDLHALQGAARRPVRGTIRTREEGPARPAAHDGGIGKGKGMRGQGDMGRVTEDPRSQETRERSPIDETGVGGRGPYQGGQCKRDPRSQETRACSALHEGLQRASRELAARASRRPVRLR